MIELKKLRGFSGTLTEFIKELEKHRRRYPDAKIVIEKIGTDIKSIYLDTSRSQKDERVNKKSNSHYQLLAPLATTRWKHGGTTRQDSSS